MYARFPHITVQELRLNQSDLNTKRMLDLMAFSTGGSAPLYMHVVNRVLRELRVEQQHRGTGFNYLEFRRRMDATELTDMQKAPLNQRLDTLESYMVTSQTPSSSHHQRQFGGAGQAIDWTPTPSQLTIVDLSCPCVTPEMACCLFNICLSLFLEQKCDDVGRVIALDEAHKYMNGDQSAECATLTEQLLGTIRLQRHLGARVLISTQEPTVSPKLLDLCSVTVVHRFTSPDWLGMLRKHLAGVSYGAKLLGRHGQGGRDGEEGMEVVRMGEEEKDMMAELFQRIVDLGVGEALMFAPSAIMGVTGHGGGGGGGGGSVQRLGSGVLKVRMRMRTTEDGGKSVMAS